MRRLILYAALFPITGAARAEVLGDLYVPAKGTSARVSDYYRSGGDGDARPIMPGETLVLADLRGRLSCGTAAPSESGSTGRR
jgi:hypothetical protein